MINVKNILLFLLSYTFCGSCYTQENSPKWIWDVGGYTIPENEYSRWSFESGGSTKLYLRVQSFYVGASLFYISNKGHLTENRNYYFVGPSIMYQGNITDKMKWFASLTSELSNRDFIYSTNCSRGSNGCDVESENYLLYITPGVGLNVMPFNKAKRLFVNTSFYYHLRPKYIFSKMVAHYLIGVSYQL